MQILRSVIIFINIIFINISRKSEAKIGNSWFSAIPRGSWATRALWDARKFPL